MKNRTLRHKIFSDHRFIGLTESAKVFYFALLCLADDHGIFESNPAIIASQVPNNEVNTIFRMLDELARSGLIRYNDGHGFIHGFMKEQRPGRPKPVHFPDGPPFEWEQYLKGRPVASSVKWVGHTQPDEPVSDVATQDPIKDQPVQAEVNKVEEGFGPDNKQITDDIWLGRISSLRQRGKWFSHYGPKPGEDGCIVPAHLLD